MTFKVNPSPFALVVANKGSTARDHLANERTYLAWFRTSLTLVVVGVAFTQLNTLGPPHPKLPSPLGINGVTLVGILYCALGLVFLMFGMYRYFLNQHQMAVEKFVPSRNLILGGAILVVLVTLFMIGFLISADHALP